jgi:hypothetical protein
MNVHFQLCLCCLLLNCSYNFVFLQLVFLSASRPTLVAQKQSQDGAKMLGKLGNGLA